MNLFVRIQKKTGAERFFRAGILFTKDWQQVEVDDATASRLHEEQMLEVSDGEPESDEAAVSKNTAPADTVDPASVPNSDDQPQDVGESDAVGTDDTTKPAQAEKPAAKAATKAAKGK